MMMMSDNPEVNVDLIWLFPILIHGFHKLPKYCSYYIVIAGNFIKCFYQILFVALEMLNIGVGLTVLQNNFAF